MDFQKYEVRCSAGKVEALIETEASSRARAKNQAADLFRHSHNLKPSVCVKTEIIEVKEPQPMRREGEQLSNMLFLGSLLAQNEKERVAKRREEIDLKIEFLSEELSESQYFRLVIQPDILAYGLSAPTIAICATGGIFTCEAMEGKNFLECNTIAVVELRDYGYIQVRMCPDFKESESYEYLERLLTYVIEIQLVEEVPRPDLFCPN